MITVLIALSGATYLFVEASRRGQNPWKWAGIAIATIMGPIVLLGWYVIPITMTLLGFHYEGHLLARLSATLGLVGAGVYLFFLARMRLVRHPKLTARAPPPEMESDGPP